MNTISLPDEWPAGFPLPEGAVPVLDESDAEALRVSFTAPAGTDLRTFFTARLPEGGWEIQEDEEFEIEGHGFYGQVELEISQESTGFCVQLVR